MSNHAGAARTNHYGDEGHHVDCASYLSDDATGERYACDCTPIRVLAW